MVRTLMVYPEYRDPTFWSFKEALRIIGKKANMPPYGLATIAAMLPRHYDVTLIDENVATLRDEDIKNADVVMSSAMIVQRSSLRELIDKCRHYGKPIIVGGPLVSTGFEEVPGATSYFIGEAEQGLPRLVLDLEKGQLKKAYGHVANGVTTAEEKAARIRDHFGNDISLIVGERPTLERTLVPRFDLFDVKQYAAMAVQYSRGCPVKCEFCDIWTQGGVKPRLKETDRFLAELDAIHATGFEGGVFFVDDNFYGNKNRVTGELLPAVTRWQQDRGYPYRLFTEATITIGDDPKFLKAMHGAGFDMVFCGIETPSESALLETNKKLNTDHKNHNTMELLVQRVENIQRAGIEVSSGFILGFDNEEPDIDDRMIYFIERAKIAMAMLGLLTALPETKLYERLRSEGRLKKASEGNNTHALDVNFVPKNTTEDELVRKYNRVLNALYDPALRNYFARVDRMMDTMGKPMHGGRRVTFEGIKHLLSALYHVGPTRHGPEFIKFLAKRLWKDSSTFAEAVTYGVKGHHLAHITNGTRQVHAVSTYID
ncbi:MAG: radical SAM protein, partial [Nanoarchaeota archaeon]